MIILVSRLSYAFAGYRYLAKYVQPKSLQRQVQLDLQLSLSSW